MADTDQDKSFAETAMELGGKSRDEAQRIGKIDKADDQVESLFQPQYQTVNSPAHRAVWDSPVPVELFRSTPPPDAGDGQRVMEESLVVVRRHRAAGTLHTDVPKVSESVLRDLASVGYWGLLVDKKYGGSGLQFRSFAPFLTRMAMEEPTIAGLASVHGCIGAVDPIQAFGNDDQKARWLPKLASGERLSAFALTEPGAGSDLTALKTRAVLRGDHYYVTGEKLFITNVNLGRTIGLVCLVEDQPAVLVVDLPDRESEQFQFRQYGLYALRYTDNRGLIFHDFPVPAENLLKPKRGNGLTIAYHGLNLGRVALCANAAGVMRRMLASMLPWGEYRVTYGEAIAKRELVRRRIARLAGLIVACDALVAWCATLLDDGYRGEMECIVAKIFGSESLKEAAVELLMKTHGGRSFLHGHLFGDHVHDYLAPCIYEGEGEMLSMAFFKSLVKDHGSRFFAPLGKSLAEAGIKDFQPWNPIHLWTARESLLPYGWWWMRQHGPRAGAKFPEMSDDLRSYAQFAVGGLQDAPLEISGMMRKHQLKLADRQCRMAEMSGRVQQHIVLLCTALYAADQKDEIVRRAGEILCQDLIRQITGRRPTDSYFKAVSELGGEIAEGKTAFTAQVDPGEILQRYS